MKITYLTKQNIRSQNAPAYAKVTAEDLNEIKEKHNQFVDYKTKYTQAIIQVTRPAVNGVATIRAVLLNEFEGAPSVSFATDFWTINFEDFVIDAEAKVHIVSTTGPLQEAYLDEDGMYVQYNAGQVPMANAWVTLHIFYFPHRP
jgi:hypothetical protein